MRRGDNKKDEGDTGKGFRLGGHKEKDAPASTNASNLAFRGGKPEGGNKPQDNNRFGGIARTN